jgi:hypothetical protein
MMSEQQGQSEQRSPTNAETHATCLEYAYRVRVLADELHRFLSKTDAAAMAWSELLHAAQMLFAAVSILNPGILLPERFRAVIAPKSEPPASQHSSVNATSNGLFKPKQAITQEQENDGI